MPIPPAPAPHSAEQRKLTVMPKKGRQATRMTPGFTGPFKGDPQPGTLFDVRALDQLPGNTNLTRQRPGPRGYSPARLAEMREAFDTAHVTGSSANETTRPVIIGGQGRANETAHQFGPSSWHPDDPHFGRAKSRILDTMSRSTINVKDEMENPLQGLGQIRYERSMPGVAGQYRAHDNYGPPDETGTRKGLGPTVVLYGHDLAGSSAAAMGRDEKAEQTLLHEVGHHDSYIAGNESASYDTPSKMAREEAHADKFAVTHFRRDPRNTGAYDPREHTYMARGDTHFEGHGQEYEAALPASMHPPAARNLGPQFHQPELDATQPLGRLHQIERGGGKWPDVFIGKDIEK